MMAEEKLRVGTWVSLITLAIIIAGGWMQDRKSVV